MTTQRKERAVINPSKNPRSAFSVLYGEGLAADWDYWEKGRWSRSEKVTSIRWDPLRGLLDEDGYEAILRRFGLKKKEVSVSEVVKTSPAALAAKRREKEKRLGLKKLEILSDTAGDRRPAEEYT